MLLDVGRLFQASNPQVKLDLSKTEAWKYYIDFSPVRGGQIINALRRSIMFSADEPTRQLFTGHIGCGKSTELSRLQEELEDKNFHVVYFESTDELDLENIDISDLLLVIARQISRSLEAAQIKIGLQPTRFQSLLQGAVNLLNSEVTGAKFKVPQIGDVGFNADSEKVSLSFGIGEITTKAKDSRTIRDLLRQYIEPQIQAIVQAINTELIEPAQQKLKEQGKAGLVVIADNLDRIANKPKSPERTVPEYLFAERGELLNRLRCHVIYTIPLILTFSNEQETIKQRFGSNLNVLPMVRVKERDGSICEEGIDLLRKMILARAFPDIEPEQRKNYISELFDTPETLDRLCQVSGGHVRNLLLLLRDCLKEDDPPFSHSLIERVISQGRNQLSKAIDRDEWELIRQIVKEQKMSSEKEYEILRSSFIFEYHNNDDVWFDINPILAGAKELTDE